MTENNKCFLCGKWINMDVDLPLNCKECPKKQEL